MPRSSLSGPSTAATPGPPAELAAVFAGYLACRAGLAEPNVPVHGVRRGQHAQLGVALAWAAKALGIEWLRLGIGNTHPQVQQ